MAGTYTRIYIQVVIAVKNRDHAILPSWEEELFGYIPGIIEAKGQKPIITNGMPDHVHIFMGIKPSISISDLVRDIKNNSTNFINARGFTKTRFSWQTGFGAFSYGHSQIGDVYNYILNQKEHHRKRTFLEEYMAFLEKFHIAYDERYLFD